MGTFVQRGIRVTAIAAAIGFGVSCTLDSEDDPAPDEIAYTTSSCPASYMRPSPLAKQCCYDNINYDTMFERGADHALVVRDGNPWGWKCKSSSGGACAGSACYFGPCGFAKPRINVQPPQIPYVHTVLGACASTWYTNPPPPEFPNVTGTCPFTSCKDGVPGTVGPDVGYWEY